MPTLSLGKAGLKPATLPRGPGRCPLWGPCLGRRGYLGDALADLAADLAPELYDSFRVEISGCPLDCRHAAARADLALVLDARATWFVIWLGGRHRSFFPAVTPKAWLRREMAGVRELLDLVFKVHDFWGGMAMGDETFPELAARIGLERLERFLAEPSSGAEPAQGQPGRGRS